VVQQPGQAYPPQQYPPQQYPQQMPPQGYPQQMPPQQYPPQQFVQVVEKKKGWARLERDSIFIKQQMNLLQQVSGCITGNTFKMYPLGKDGEQRGHALFKAKEESGFCAKQCLAGDCRPFTMRVKLDDDSEELDNEDFLKIDRPCKCTCWCFNRPEITVSCVEDGKDTYIGKVVNPWTCCNVQLDVYDAANVLKYKIEASCCQLGFHCHAPCESCQTIDFDIKSPSGEVVSTLQKRAPSCVAAMATNMENFLVHFPKNATKEDKALLMCATLFADYRFFEKKNNARGSQE